MAVVDVDLPASGVMGQMKFLDFVASLVYSFAFAWLFFWVVYGAVEETIRNRRDKKWK